MSDESEPSQPEPPTQKLGATRAEGLFALGKEDADPLPTPEELQRDFPQYEILALLGRGGMGVVYKAKHKGLDRFVAIKLLPPALGDDADFAARFQREARAMAKLEHPNIIAVHDFGQTPDGRLYLVMDFVDGANLAELIRSGAFTDSGREAAPRVPERSEPHSDATHSGTRGAASLPPPLDPLSIASQLCDALAYAHGEGIVHRDIKPANVMLDRKGRVKVADFGLARIIAAEVDGSALTTTGTVMGTLDYMAPEQRKGMAVDHRADIYSLGVILYEMLCGEVPHGMFDPPSTRVGCPRAFDTIVAAALRPDPDQRYASTQEMKTALEAARTAEFTVVPAAQPLAIPPAAKRRAPIYVAALLVVLVIAGGIFFATRKQPRESSASATAAPAAQAKPFAAGVPIKLWDTAEKLPHDPAHVRWEEGAIVLHDDVSVTHPDPKCRDAILRASVRMHPDAAYVQIALRTLGSAPKERRYVAGLHAPAGKPPEIQLSSVTDSAYRLLARWPLPRTYRSDEWLRLELKAVGDQITVTADGQVLGSIRDASQPQAGGVMLYARAHGHFRDIEYVPLDGTVRPTSPDSPAIKLWDTPETIPSGSTVQWVDNAVRLDRTNGLFYNHRSRDAILRAFLRMNADAEAPQLCLRYQGKDAGASFYRLEIQPPANRVRLHRVLGEEQTILREWALPRRYGPDEWLRVEFRAVGDELTALADGLTLGAVRDSALREPGKVMLWANTAGYFRDIEYVPLDVIASAPAERWVDLLLEANALSMGKGATVGPGGLSLPAGAYASSAGAQQFRPDGAVRFRSRFDPAVKALSARVRTKDSKLYALFATAEGFTVELHQWSGAAAPPRRLADFKLPKPIAPGQEYELELRVVGSRLTARLDGQTLGEVEDTTLSEGSFGVGTAPEAERPATITRLEYLDLGGAAK